MTVHNIFFWRIIFIEWIDKTYIIHTVCVFENHVSFETDIDNWRHDVVSVCSVIIFRKEYP